MLSNSLFHFVLIQKSIKLQAELLLPLPFELLAKSGCTARPLAAAQCIRTDNMSCSEQFEMLPIDGVALSADPELYKLAVIPVISCCCNPGGFTVAGGLH